MAKLLTSPGTVEVSVDDLSDRQMLRLVLQQQDEILTRIESLEAHVANLSEAVEELKASVDGVAQRLLPKIEAAEAALATAHQQLEAALADDEAAAALFAEAEAAVASIRTETDRLNALGADPSTPIEPDPGEPVGEDPVGDDPGEGV